MLLIILTHKKSQKNNTCYSSLRNHLCEKRSGIASKEIITAQFLKTLVEPSTCS